MCPFETILLPIILKKWKFRQKMMLQVCYSEGQYDASGFAQIPTLRLVEASAASLFNT